MTKMDIFKQLLAEFFRAYLHLAESKSFGAPPVSTDELAEALVDAVAERVAAAPAETAPPAEPAEGKKKK